MAAPQDGLCAHARERYAQFGSKRRHAVELILFDCSACSLEMPSVT